MEARSMKIVINNTQKTKHEDFSDYLKRKWEARDNSSYTDAEDSDKLCKKQWHEFMERGRSKKSPGKL